MRRRYWLRLGIPLPLVFVQRFLAIFGEKSDIPPDESLMSAVAGTVTKNLSTAFVLSAESIPFLLAFIMLYGDMIAEQQRTGAIYRFSRMPGRRAWMLRQFGNLALCAFAYCGVYVGLHAAVSVFSTGVACDWGRFLTVAAQLWAVISLAALFFACLCNGLCGCFGGSVGTAGAAITAVMLAGFAIYVNTGEVLRFLNPAAYPDTVFSSPAIALSKMALLVAETGIVAAISGRYFCTKDIFAAEGEG